MAVAVRSVSWVPSSGDGDVSSASISCPKPTGTASGDLLVAIVSRSQTSATTSAFTSSGWTSAAFFAGSTTGNQVPVSVMWKVAGGSEPSSYTFFSSTSATDQFSVHIYALTGADTSNPFYATPTAATTGSNSATGTAPSVTLGGAGLLITWYGLTYYTTSSTTTWSTPSGMTSRVNANTDTGVWLQVGTFSESRPTGASGSRASTYSGGTQGRARAVSFAIREGVTSVAPTVNAGADVAMNQFETLNRTATEDDGGATITARSWTVVSGPAYVGNTLSTSAALSWEPETAGSFVLRYSATNSQGTDTDDIAVSVDTVFHSRYINLPLQASAVGSANFTGDGVDAPLILSGDATDETKSVSDEPIAPLTLDASIDGRRINVASANIKLTAVLTSYGRPGQGSANARIKLTAACTGTGSRNAPASAPLTLTGVPEGSKDVPGELTAALLLAGSHEAAKDIPGAFEAPIILSATRIDFTRSTAVSRTAIVQLSTNTTDRFTTRGDAQLAPLYLSAPIVTTSVRFNSNYTAPFIISASVFGYRVEAEITDALRFKADLTTKYELVCVARIPQASGPPALLEVDPIDWTGITITEELNKPSTLSIETKFTKLTNEVLNRFRNPDELATEIWLNRNGKRIFAGPLLGVNATNEGLTLEAKDILAYTAMWIIEDDIAYKDREQFEIVADLVNRWQTTTYGNFGLVTTDIPPSGVLRSKNYFKKEMTQVYKAIEDMGKTVDGFDFSVDPVSRRLRLHYPERGTDRSTGEDAIVFDSRNVSSETVTFSVGPSDLASDSFGSATQTDEAVLYSQWFNEELRTRYGRTAYGSTYDSAKDQSSLDLYTEAGGRARSRTLYIPGPNTRVTPDADINNYEVGDWVSYTMHNKLNALGAFRLRKRTTAVADTGKENVSVEFV